MPVNETIFLPNVEPDPDARNLQAVRVFGRRLLGVAVKVHDIIDVVGVIDEIYAISCQH